MGALGCSRGRPPGIVLSQRRPKAHATGANLNRRFLSWPRRMAPGRKGSEHNLHLPGRLRHFSRCRLVTGVAA